MQDMNAVVKERYNKLKELEESGINAYKNKSERKNKIEEAYKTAEKLKNEEKGTKKYTIAGRILAYRTFGKLTFATIRDDTASIQLFVKEEELDKDYGLFKKLDLGDIIEATGLAYKTQRGEPSLFIKKFALLTKSLRPLPDKWSGLKDTELRYRHRYVDLIVNPEVKKAFEIKMMLIQEVRNHLMKEGYIEVETPILQPIYGGGIAKPFKTFHNELKKDMYLRISNELYLKRLVVGGYEKIFEFSRDFRNEGIDATHNPEFTVMETMWAYADYKDNMVLCEKMMESIAKKILGTTEIEFQGTKISLKTPWARVSMKDAVRKYAKIDFDKITDKQAKEEAQKLGIKVEKHWGKGAIMEAIFEETCEEEMIQPTLVYGHSAETSPLAKRNEENPEVTDRFEIFILGKEYGNSYTELNNPIQQKKAFEDGMKKREAGDMEAHAMDEDYVNALEYGMPPTSGLGIGIDRWAMLFTNSASIRDVLFFPMLKDKE